MTAVRFNNPFQRITEIGWDNLFCVKFLLEQTGSNYDSIPCGVSETLGAFPPDYGPGQGIKSWSLDLSGSDIKAAWVRLNGNWAGVVTSEVETTFPPLGDSIGASFGELEYAAYGDLTISDPIPPINAYQSSEPGIANIPLPPEAVSTAADVFDGGDRFTVNYSAPPVTGGTPHCYNPNVPGGAFLAVETYECGSPVVAASILMRLFDMSAVYDGKNFEVIANHFEYDDTLGEGSRRIVVYALMQFSNNVTG